MKRILIVLSLVAFVSLLLISCEENNCNCIDPNKDLSQMEMKVEFEPHIAYLESGFSYVYELYFDHVPDTNISVERIRVRSYSGDNVDIYEFDKEFIDKSSMKLFDDKRTYLIFMWIDLDDREKAADSLVHEVLLNFPDGTTKEIIGAKTEPVNEKPIEIHPPLEYDNWLISSGPSNYVEHRRAFLELSGHRYISQRFAIDFVKYGDNKKLYDPNPNENENYHCFGKNLLAVADGEVVALVDGLPNNTPPNKPDMHIFNATGNYLVLKIAEERYAFYAHIIPGTFKVKIGEKVNRGEILARLGNSGNSDAPHLHFHICTSPDALFSQGVPYVFNDYVKSGHYPGYIQDFMDDKPWTDMGKMSEPRSGIMPVNADVVNFGF